MRLSYSPLYYGIRLAYNKYVPQAHNPISRLLYKVVALGVQALLLTSLTHAAYANTQGDTALIVNDIVFSESGYDFTADTNAVQVLTTSTVSSDALNNDASITNSISKAPQPSTDDTVDFLDNHQFYQALNTADSPKHSTINNSELNTGNTAVNKQTKQKVNTVTPITDIQYSTNHKTNTVITTPIIASTVTNSDISTVSDTANTEVADPNVTEVTDRNVYTLDPIKSAHKQDDSINKSLERLAEFYEFNQTDLLSSQSNHDSSTQPIQPHITSETTVINANSISPATFPKLFNKDQDVPRCAGVWVTPSNSKNYRMVANLDKASSIDDTLYSQSDYAYYDNEYYVELSGDVKLVQGSQLIESEHMVMDLRQGIAGAKGGVLFSDSGSNNAYQTLGQAEGDGATSGLIGVADHLTYDSNNAHATAYDVAFASVSMQAHGYAGRLNRPNDSQIELDDVMFTTCPPHDRKWQIQADQIDLDADTGRAEAYNTTFRLGDVPILYLPYFNFPIDSRRSSGFLVPSASVDIENGLQIRVPYYFNLAPNYDATLTTQIFSNRNPMLAGEFRYLSKYGEGELVTTYLPRDKQYNHDDRNALFYRHNWIPYNIEHLNVGAVYNYVSDPDYINDFDKLGQIDNDLNLPRRLQVDYYNDYLSGRLKVETFQSLEAKDAEGNLILDKDKPYAKLPQLSINYQLPWIDALNISGIHDSAYFKKSINDGSENEKSGVRIYNELSASLPLQSSWGYVTPKAKLQHLFTAYDETSRIDNNLSKKDSSNGVFVPQLSVDTGLNFYQAGSPLGWYDDTMGGYQLLSPRLKYVYAPYKRQNEIPNFNTRVASINYEQLFEDSWLLGYDRISDNHAITPGINYRYIDAMGVTRFDASIAKQFILDTGQVTLGDNESLLSDDTVGVVWNSSAQPYRNLWFNFDGALKSNDELNYLTAGIRYQPTKNSLLNLHYVKRTLDDDTNQLPLSAWTASTMFPINNRTRLLAKAQYDDKRHKVIDSLVGIDYEDCCYGMAIYGREYYNDLNLSEDPTRAIMFEFRINGFGEKSSSRLNRLATQKITGFETVDENWRY